VDAEKLQAVFRERFCVLRDEGLLAFSNHYA